MPLCLQTHTSQHSTTIKHFCMISVHILGHVGPFYIYFDLPALQTVCYTERVLFAHAGSIISLLPTQFLVYHTYLINIKWHPGIDLHFNYFIDPRIWIRVNCTLHSWNYQDLTKQITQFLTDVYPIIMNSCTMYAVKHKSDVINTCIIKNYHLHPRLFLSRQYSEQTHVKKLMTHE